MRGAPRITKMIHERKDLPSFRHLSTKSAWKRCLRLELTANARDTQKTISYQFYFFYFG